MVVAPGWTTVTVWAAVAFWPASSVTVNTIGNAPAAANWCDAVTPLFVTPLPKSQSCAASCRPGAAVDAPPLTVTIWPMAATVGDTVNVAVRVPPPGCGETVVVDGGVTAPGPTGVLVSQATRNTASRTAATSAPVVNLSPVPASLNHVATLNQYFSKPDQHDHGRASYFFTMLNVS